MRHLGCTANYIQCLLGRRSRSSLRGDQYYLVFAWRCRIKRPSSARRKACCRRDGQKRNRINPTHTGLRFIPAKHSAFPTFIFPNEKRYVTLNLLLQDNPPQVKAAWLAGSGATLFWYRMILTKLFGDEDHGGSDFPRSLFAFFCRIVRRLRTCRPIRFESI